MLQRVSSALIALIVVFTTLLMPTLWPIVLLCSFIGIFSLRELQQVLASSTSLFSWQKFLISLLFGMIPIVISFLTFKRVMYFSFHSGILMIWLLFGIGIWAIFQIIKGNKREIHPVLANFWITAPLCLIVLSYQELGLSAGKLLEKNPVFLILVPVWAGDSMAYFTGKKFGKHPLWKKISPSKTWEGSIAYFGASLLTAWALHFLVEVDLLQALGCGFFAGTFGQLGDLMESALKRSVQLKDSGTFLPGHGGVLDRLDSLFFNIMPSATLLLLTT